MIGGGGQGTNISFNMMLFIRVKFSKLQKLPLFINAKLKGSNVVKHFVLTDICYNMAKRPFFNLGYRYICY